MGITLDEMQADYFAHLYIDNPNAANADEDEDFDLDEIVAAMADNDNWEDVS